MQTANDIRTAFLDFFQRHGHAPVSSSPLVPHNDPTLMFTNAGMVQFKNVFTGAEHRDYVRAATSQKCVRAGGKHNDLENVGYTARHHTFFEMLGNFSFGDYFKEHAIDFAWTLVTKELGLDAKKLLVTVYHEDDDAAALWKKIAGLSDDRIIRIATSDNFWSMGDTGPCGPCSEIFYDHGESIPGGPPGSPDEDGDRFIEIWNLVFMQFEQHGDGTRTDLPRPSIDTGMGLERIAAVLQGKHDNYDIDLMRALIEASAEASNVDPDGDHAVSHRVIADHLRASSFLIADGVLPSNEGRGYVLRRIMRRAMRHIAKLGVRDPMMYRLVPSLVTQMGGHFGELVRAKALIEETLKLEETRFRTTLDRGMRLLEDETAKLGDSQALPGEVAFTLYDTYGFPLDLTQDVLRGQGRRVDEDGFATAMAAQKAKARAAWSGSGEAATEQLWFDLQERDGATEFLGYDSERAEGLVTAVIREGAEVAQATAGDTVQILTNQTPFYGESGGQAGDIGGLFTAEGCAVTITDTQKKLGALHVHLGQVTKGSLAKGARVQLHVDQGRRTALRGNHSATHLLHEALRQALGDHVTQKGSLVAQDRLRFDIAHPKPLSADELRRVEAMVNLRIRENSPVVTRLMTSEAAIEQGAMALFGEKYGDEVRVVSMGGEETPSATRKPFSVELCGGTHAKRTGDIGLFKILSESAVAAGVRRIEALTGEAALAHVEAQDTLLQQLAQALKTTAADVPSRVESLLEDKRTLERELSESRRKLALGGGGGQGSGTDQKEIAGMTFVGRVLEGLPAKELKGTADEIKKQIGSAVVVVIAESDGKASIVVTVSADLTDRVSAVDLVRLGSAALGGKGGGGRPDMAQAGGPDPQKAPEALAAIEAALAKA